MDSCGVKVKFTLNAQAIGTSINPNIKLALRALRNIGLTSTGTGAAQANEIFGYYQKSLAISTSVTYDLRSYTNVLGETAKALAEVRVLYVEHDSSSTATSITVGNAASNQFVPLGMSSATTTFTLVPGAGFLMWDPSAAAMTADGTHKDIKILNNSASAAAIYNIYAIGSIS